MPSVLKTGKELQTIFVGSFFPSFLNADGIKAKGIFFWEGGSLTVYRAAGIKFAVVWHHLHGNILIFAIFAVSVKYQDIEGKTLITL